MSNDFDGFTNQLDRWSKNMKQLQGTHSVPFSEMFPTAFMQKHTGNRFASFDAFLNASGFSDVSFKDIPDDVWDQWIANNTDLQSWENMRKVAGEEYVTKKLFH